MKDTRKANLAGFWKTMKLAGRHADAIKIGDRFGFTPDEVNQLLIQAEEYRNERAKFADKLIKINMAKETDKAVMINIWFTCSASSIGDLKRTAWLPKSQLTITESGYACPVWLYKEKVKSLEVPAGFYPDNELEIYSN